MMDYVELSLKIRKSQKSCGNPLEFEAGDLLGKFGETEKIDGD
jgi:hypothetical protein